MYKNLEQMKVEGKNVISATLCEESQNRHFLSDVDAIKKSNGLIQNSLKQSMKVVLINSCYYYCNKTLLHTLENIVN